MRAMAVSLLSRSPRNVFISFDPENCYSSLESSPSLLNAAVEDPLRWIPSLTVHRRSSNTRDTHRDSKSLRNFETKTLGREDHLTNYESTDFTR